MIEYQTSYLNEATKKRFKKKVFGKIIHDFPIAGTFAIRQATAFLWTVDHVETGLAVADANSFEGALAAAIKTAEIQGQDGFDRAIAKAIEMRITAAQL